MPPVDNEQLEDQVPDDANVEDVNDDVDTDEIDGEIDYEAEYGCTEEEYQEAVEQGWNPDFDGPNARSAKEFIERGSFFRKIEAQNQTIAQMQEQLKFFMDRADAADAAARESLKDELLAAKRDALAEDDTDKVVEIDEKLMELHQENAARQDDDDEEDDTPDNSGPNPEYEKWEKENQWYVTNPKMHRVADALVEEYIVDNGKPETPAELRRALNHVTKEIKTLYKGHFMNDKREDGSPVDTGTGKRRGRKASTPKYTVDDLDPSEQIIMNNMLRVGTIKEPQEYVDQLAKQGVFKDR